LCFTQSSDRVNCPLWPVTTASSEL